MQKKIAHSLLLTVICSALFACGGSRSNDPVEPTQSALDKTLQLAVDRQIIPVAQKFATAAASYSAQADNFCALQDANSLADLQQSWKNLALHWYHLLPYNFGPMKNDVVFPNFMFVDAYRLRGTSYTATVREEIADVIASSEPLGSGYFDFLPFQKGGLLALEVLSFESANQQRDSDAIVQSYAASSARCELLTGHAAQLVKRAEAITVGWQQSYNGETRSYRERFLAAELPDGTPPLTELLTVVQEHLDYLKQRSAVTSVAQIAEIPWDLMTATVTEIDALLHGRQEDQFNFIAVMRSAGATQAADTVEGNLAFVFQSINARNVTDFEVGVSLLDGNFKREIPNGLDVDLGITFTDGD